MLVDVLAAVALAAWLGVLLLPSEPWRIRERLVPEAAAEGGSIHADLGGVTVLIPARNEAAEIGATLRGLTGQGDRLEVVVIDDQSDDGTAEAAHRANAAFPESLDLKLIEGRELPPGWGGKLWALDQGLAKVEREFCLLLDAEIILNPGVIDALLRKACDEDRAMVSVMARLRCESLWEKLLVPPFIFFFKLLYPFSSVNDPRRRTAAAAGGCILIRAEVLRALGGFGAFRDALIDDCTLAARVKGAGHSIWLGLSDSVSSSRAYVDLRSFRAMVTRTAFTQLHHSALLLGLVVIVMAVVFVAPIVALAAASGQWGVAAGAGAYAAMAAAYWPTVRFYRLAAFRVFSLPIAGVLFLAMTVESALRYWRGVTAEWKGRTYRSGSWRLR
jgi:hopene-associated glycosyltransferase HpnB